MKNKPTNSKLRTQYLKDRDKIYTQETLKSRLLSK